MHHSIARHSALGFLAALLISTTGSASPSPLASTQASTTQGTAGFSSTCTKVKRIIAEKADVPPSSVTDSADLVHDLGMDELDLIELAMHFEDEFEIEIPDEHVELIHTVGDACKYVEGAVGS
ncbi:acyl carrier protein [Myxococcus sp. XM-1-1-1]|uniref:acyl carrier protein n=1 Tax=Myxococcus sp. XM-1-1-1 TaxID=2874602 RepID=UPI001DBC7CB1|nr:acyl carrier protein [Myxococcus sp. XM-1-1-1]